MRVYSIPHDPSEGFGPRPCSRVAAQVVLQCKKRQRWVGKECGLREGAAGHECATIQAKLCSGDVRQVLANVPTVGTKEVFGRIIGFSVHLSVHLTSLNGNQLFGHISSLT